MLAQIGIDNHYFFVPAVATIYELCVIPSTWANQVAIRRLTNQSFYKINVFKQSVCTLVRIVKQPMSLEIELLYKTSRGDKVAFRELYNLYSDRVYATALHYLQNIEDAQEVTQDVFVNIFQKANTFKGNSSLTTWVYRIVVNTSLNFLHKRNRNIFLFSENLHNEIPNFEHPGILEENKEVAKLMYAAINTLPNAQKTAFIFGFIEEKPRQEIADIMEISLKAVESLLQRAKENLRKKLEELNPNRRN